MSFHRIREAYVKGDEKALTASEDREAQRAIRQRTKEQIESLERKIQELTNQQPYQELLAVQRAKEAVEQENAEIKRRLAAIIGDLQPLIGGSSTGDVGRVYASPTETYIAPTPGTPGSMDVPGSEATKHQLVQQRVEMRHGLDMGPERLGLGFLLEGGQGVSRILQGSHGAQDTGRFQHVPMKHDWTDARNAQALKARPGSSGWDVGRSNGFEGQLHLHQYRPRDERHTYASPAPGAQWSIQVKNSAPTCPLDHLLLDFLSERHQRAAEGLPTAEVVGPKYPSVSSLLNPSNSAYSHPLSKVFTDILATFPDISALPERVAVLYIMFLVMRWQVLPTPENYDRLPPWMRPTASQLSEPHPAWIDHIPYPLMREHLAKHWNPTEYLFDNFFIPFTSTLRLGWPYEETDTLLQSADGEEIMINPVFERHLRNNENWTLGEGFLRAFPSLAETCNVDSSTVARGDSGRATS